MRFPSSLSSVAISTSLIRGAYDRKNQRKILLLRERSPHRSHQDFVALVEVDMRVGIESSTGIFSNQSNDVVMEHVERETLSEVSLEVRLEEVVTLSEEIPSMVKLDAPQSGKFVRLVFGAERIIGDYCHKDSSNADSTSDKLAVLTGDWIQDGRIGGEHGNGEEAWKQME